MTKRSRSGFAGALVLVAVLAGCGALDSVEPYTPITDPHQLFVSLRLNARAVTLATVAPGDTFRLAATPMNAAGAAITGLPAPQFTSSDTTSVWVTPDGLLQARQPATGVMVIAEVVNAGNIRQADTAYVNVTAGPPPPAPYTLSIDPVSPDSGLWTMIPTRAGLGQLVLTLSGAPILQRVNPRPLDGTGTPMPDISVEFESLDPGIAVVGRTDGAVTPPFAPGQVSVVARAIAYGVPLVDTAAFKVTLPSINGVWYQVGTDGVARFSAPEVTIRQNGYVFWSNLTPDSVDVIFDDVTNVQPIAVACASPLFAAAYCPAGNIPAFGSVGGFIQNTRGRQFPVPGVYTFHSTRSGQSGRIIVVAGDS